MALAIYYIVFLAGFCGITITSIKLNKKGEKSISLFLKIASLIIALVFAVRYMSGADAISQMYRLTNTPFTRGIENVFALLLVWSTYVSVLLVSLYGFFKIEFIDKIIKYFALTISLINAIFMGFNFTAIIGENAINAISFRGIVFALEIGLTLAYSAFIFISTTNFKKVVKEKTKEKKKTFSNEKNSFYLYCKIVASKIYMFFKKYGFYIFSVIALFISVMPAYALQGLFGNVEQRSTCKDVQQLHRVIIYIGIALPFVIHFSLRNKSCLERRFYLLYICLGTLITFSLNHKAETFLNPVSWPLHLCNTAMYIMPVVLIFNMKKFFYFTYFINVVGAFFAMLMPNYDATINIFSTGLEIFYYNHYIAFFMPILFVSLGMFEKPKFKQFVYSMLGFLGYFVLVLILNAVFTGLYQVGKVSGTTDFFFINSDFIADKLGQWAERLRDIKAVFTIGEINLTFYPLYQILFFLVYVVIGSAMWFIYEQGYEISASFNDIRERKKAEKIELMALEIKVNGGNFKEPMEAQNVNKLILRDFSKKYSGSNVFAVEKANLEVNGGEIFGFLGPNGAGKSTIIKTTVGIQPITSGEIIVCGYDVETQGVEAKKEIGFVPDHYALYEKLTGREYINYIADLYNVSKEDRENRINNYVKRFELETAFDNQMKTYSHGMKQKIAIMSALVHNPKVWILDEPLTGLDPNSIFQVKECMKEHAKAGNIVFFSSHIIDVVERICDRIAIIKKGHILVCKTVKEIEESGITLEQFYMEQIGQNIDGESKKTIEG